MKKVCTDCGYPVDNLIVCPFCSNDKTKYVCEMCYSDDLTKLPGTNEKICYPCMLEEAFR